ncbi:MAG: CASTOR/POLLUX-related putative ion channel [Cellulophaga fucicola]
MKNSFADRLNYKAERFLSKGGSSIFKSLLIIFIVVFVVLVGLRLILINIFPSLDYTGNIFRDIWVTFLEMTDPGNMNQDNDAPTFLKVLTVLSGLTGVILLSMLIGFITTALDTMLYDFRKGRGKVIESNHTIILGWNERVVDVIRELILANESESKASVVILSNEDKEEMDNLITKRLPDMMTTEVITTQGDYANINELKRINLESARSIIILAGCSESATLSKKKASDVQSVKSILAITACQNGKNELPIIAEIFTKEKRDIISFFEDDNIIAIDSWNIMGKLLIQTSLTSGLDTVYKEILSFDGCEIYFYEDQWNNLQFGELSYYLKDGIPLGIYSEEEGLVLRPPVDTILSSGDSVVILAEDDSTISFEGKQYFFPNRDKKIIDVRLEQKKKRILILGWHKVAEVFIEEATDYLLDGSDFDILFDAPTEELTNAIDEIAGTYPDFNINLHDSNPLDLDNLEKINPESYDTIVILSQSMEEQSADKIYSDTLIILLLLRKVVKDANGLHIITQVLNSENQEIITQTNVDDFIISNKLITMILAQLSEEALMKTFYDDIFSEDGSEIYVKPATLYFDTFPQKITFADAIFCAQQRDEICLGIRKGDLSKSLKNNFGITLNLSKDTEIELLENDFLIVLSEDEL